MYKKGIDISHKSGEIDFTKVKGANINYAFIKATEGATFQDPNYGKYRHDVLCEGMIAATYHCFRALSSTPEAQKDNIVNVLTKNGFNSSHEYFALDVEPNGNEDAPPKMIADKLYDLLLLLGKEAVVGNKRPFIYCSPSFLNKKVTWSKLEH
ncbi:MAG TPA: glycoside hydrolase family 25 protein [Xylella sp.]